MAPHVVQQAGGRAEEKCVECFAAGVRHVNTRVACLRAERTVFVWVEAKGLRLDPIRPVHVAASVELLTGPVPAPW